MIKTTLWMGMSLNGIIARDNNEEDFISHDCWLTWIKAIKECGCMIWGRKTYQIVEQWPEQYLKDIEGVKAVVVSSNPDMQLKDGFELAPSPEAALEKLAGYGYDRVIITGGSAINSSFAKNNLIDEIVFLIEPVIVGKGIPVFNVDLFDLKLKFIEINHINENILTLKYSVNKK